MTDQQRRKGPSARTFWLLGIVGVALAGASLILLIPSLFRPGTHAPVWLLAGLAVLVAVFAAGAWHWRREVVQS
ncbi:hypothetical protein [Kineococcus sp. R86509]|uniref:hypothetical protein n=1 Tax=Kineococcus sp. R86509 TaxID=3093851 RepID=UPI0036D38686